MTNFDIAQQRLHNQFISRRMVEKPADVVRWLGAVQAQDFAAAKWALGLRLEGTSDDVVEQAFADGAILRTHVMRPTWHFVSPADIRWMLALTAPRVHAANAYYYHKFELDDAVFMRSNAALIKALQGGKQLIRPELVTVLQQAGIASDDLLRFSLILMQAELEGIICSGARRGKQFTYTLLDERVPPVRTLDRDEALAEFARGYFTSHGPATVQDFVWWSGLTTADASAGLEMVSSQFIHEVVDGQTHWFSPSTSTPPTKALSQRVYLLPNYDEYIVSYTDRSAVFDTSHTNKLDARGNVLFTHTIVMDGQVVGTWKRTLKKDVGLLTLSLFTFLNQDEIHALTAAANRYGAFLGMPTNVSFEVE